MRLLIKRLKESRWMNRLSVFLYQHPGALIGLTFFLLYAGTCARDVLASDSGEFQLVAAQWGIAHPPGYALFTIVSALWVRLIPIGNLAFRHNLMSAVLAAFTLSLLFRTLYTWQHHWGIKLPTALLTSLIAVIALGTSTTFWAQATTANIRMPTMLFTAWAYALLAQWRTNHYDPKALIKLAIITGLGVGHHPSLAFVAIGWVLYIAVCEPQIFLRIKQLAALVVITALAWSIPQLYLPIRGSMEGVLFAPANIATWQGFWFHVLAKGFAGDMFAFISATDLALRFPLLSSLLSMQFAPIWLMCMLSGLVWLGMKKPRITVSLAASWLVHCFVTITYRAPQTVEYLMPAYIPMVLCLGLSMGSLVRSVSRISMRMHLASRVIPIIMLLIMLVGIPHTAAEYGLTANDDSIRQRVEPLLEQASNYDNSLIMADWRWATPLWYLQEVEHSGENVTVEYILPESDKDYDIVWQETANASTFQALFSTHYYDWTAWTFAPVGGGFQVYPRPITSLDANLPYTPVNVMVGPVEILAYQVDGQSQPGGLLYLNLAWRFVDNVADVPSFATRLWSIDGVPLGMSDRRLDGLSLQDGIQFARFTYMLPIDQCSPVINPTIGLYTVQDGSFFDMGSLPLPGIPMQCKWPDMPVEHTAYGLLVGQGPFLTGLDYDSGVEGITYAYSHWCGPGSPVTLTNDYGQITVQALQPGQCQTVHLPVDEQGLRNVTYTYLDGKRASLVSSPLRLPEQEERYTPFSKDMVLVQSKIEQDEFSAIAQLAWRSAAPIWDDYAVSVRVLGNNASGDWRLVHDIQPGLGAIPTLKWAQSGLLISDPHPFEALPGQIGGINITVYERFQLTPVSTEHGDVVKYQLP